MPQFCSDFDGIPPKKGLYEKMPQFCLDFDVISQCHFDRPSEAHGPSAGPSEANGFHDGPPKIHGPRGHCPPNSPLVGPAGRQ